MMHSLPNSPIRLPDESRLSAFSRAAMGNGWNLLSLATAVFRNYSVPEIIAIVHDDQRAADFCNVLGIDPRDIDLEAECRITRLRGAGVRWNGLEVDLGALRRARTAICPLCLRDDNVPYLRTRWEHSFPETCAIHQCTLIDTCPSCHEPLDSVRAANFNRCKCGEDLRNAIPVPCETRDTQLLERCIRERDSSLLEAGLSLKYALKLLYQGQGQQLKSHELSNLSAAVLDNPVEFAKLLPGHGAESLSIRILLADQPLNSAVLKRMELSTEHSHGIILGQWQHVLQGGVSKQCAERILGLKRQRVLKLIQSGFLECIPDDGSASRELVTLRSINELLVSLSRTESDEPPLRKDWRRVNRHRIWDHVPRISTGDASSLGYVLSVGLGSLQVSAPRPAPREILQTHLTVPMLAQLAGVHSETVRVLCSVGFLATTKTRPGQPILIAKETAEAFLARYSFAGPFAQRLGFNVRRIAERIWDQGVVPVSGPAVDGGICYLFERRDLENLDLIALGRDSSSTYSTRQFDNRDNQSTPDHGVSLADAAAKLAFTVQKAKHLMRDGTLEKIPTRTRARYVTRISVDELLKRLQDPTLVAFNVAAVELNESERSFRRRWIGAEVAREIIIAEQRFVSRSDLEKIRAIKADYDVASEVGAAAGLQRTHFVNRSRVESSGVKLLTIGKGAHRLNLIPKEMATAELAHTFG